MAKFQFRVVGNYFGNPLTKKPEFGNGYSVTGPVTVDISGDNAPSIVDIMTEVHQEAISGNIPNCNNFIFSTQHPMGSIGSDVNLYSLTAEYSLDPISRQPGTFTYHLQENLMGSDFDQVLQYYVYELTDPNDPTAPITQINRAGDRIPFSSPLSDVPGFKYDPNGNYFIVWRLVVIATGPSSSNRINVRLSKNK